MSALLATSFGFIILAIFLGLYLKPGKRNDNILLLILIIICITTAATAAQLAAKYSNYIISLF